MFMTADHARMNIPFPSSAQGERYWASVHVMLHNPWFLVAYEVGCDEEEYQTVTTILVSRSTDVVAIGNLVKVMQVAIVTPAWMNKSDGWKMESVKEMWVGSEPNAEGADTAIVCVTKEDCRHVISAFHTPENPPASE